MPLILCVCCRGPRETGTGTNLARWVAPEKSIRGAVQGREDTIDVEYKKDTKNADGEVHGRPADQIGPVGQQLLEYGRKGRVLVPTIGCYCGASFDVRKLHDLAATELAQKHGKYLLQ